jgi:hypothetical protein
MTRDASILDDLSAAATQLNIAIDVLETAISEQRSHLSAGIRRAVAGSRPPWDSQTANILLDIFAGIRELEQDIRYLMTGVIRERGSSDANTKAAITSVTTLVIAADRGRQQGVLRQFESWTWRAKIAVGEAEPLQPLPVEKGQTAPRCWNCDYATLRYRPATRVVLCINPECRSQGTIETGCLSGEPVLVWQ